MKKDLPIYDIKLSDDTQGVGFISLVDEPAIGVDWIKLAKVTIKQEPKKVNSMMAKRVTKVNSMMAKKTFGTLDGSGCFGCPPNGDGTRVNGEPDGRCKGDGSGKEGGGKVGGAKGSSKVSTVTPNGQIVDTRASEIINSSTKWTESGDTVSVKISKEEMDSIENSIATIMVEHSPYWGDKDQTKGTGPKYFLGSKNDNGNQVIKSVYISKGKLQTGYDIGWINKDNSTFRLMEHRDSRGFSQKRDAYDLFTNKDSDRALK